jgi:hypothetical protein
VETSQEVDLPPTDEAEDRVRDEQLSEALKEKAAYEALTRSPGWQRLRQWMEVQVRARTDEIILKPCTGVKDQLEAEYSKGEIATFRLIMQTVDVGLETATAVARSLENNDRNGPDDPDLDLDPDAG